jgi:hypothetical protein
MVTFWLISTSVCYYNFLVMIYVSKVDLLLAVYHISWFVWFVEMFMDVLWSYVSRGLHYFEFMF